MRKSIYVIILFILIFITTSCTNPVKDDLLNYINQSLPEISSLENEAISAFENTISNKQKSNEDIYIVLTESVIPKYTQFVEKLKEITLNTEEVSKTHKIYIKGAEKQLEALTLLKQGFDNSDEMNEIINKSNSLLNESKKYMEVYKDQIIQLVKKYKIDYKLK